MQLQATHAAQPVTTKGAPGAATPLSLPLIPVPLLTFSLAQQQTGAQSIGVFRGILMNAGANPPVYAQIMPSIDSAQSSVFPLSPTLPSEIGFWAGTLPAGTYAVYCATGSTDAHLAFNAYVVTPGLATEQKVPVPANSPLTFTFDLAQARQFVMYLRAAEPMTVSQCSVYAI